MKGRALISEGEMKTGRSQDREERRRNGKAPRKEMNPKEDVLMIENGALCNED